ncbi:type IX secretion system protein PorD [Spongiivirga citrea]|uniref:DUF4835 family protein n=2 Tax=Spongiivirga citrea TaxID=1481457 RepID=A0A6M0CI16_9FLAO|nr:DUF4835 family protein [Spongiivirga citrea]
MRRFLCLLFCSSMLLTTAQELNCKVTVNSDKIGQTNQQIFQTLERSLNDFVNKRKWTNKRYTNSEKISSNMLVNVSQFDSGNFQASIQLQVSRPVYNSTYLTPVFFHKDNDFAFQYIEFQPLVFNPNNFESNLVSVISYYVYIMIGMDAATFTPDGGKEYFAIAQQILNQAQQSGFKGWNQADNNRRNRFWLSDNLQSNTFKEFHQVMYQYHRQGLDLMHEDPKKAKVKISNTFNILSLMNKRRPNSFLLQTFFDTKSDEVLSIFSDGPQISITRTVETLNKIAPFYASKWEGIKF